MLGIHELWRVIICGRLLNVTPGPETAYIIGRSVQLGYAISGQIISGCN